MNNQLLQALMMGMSGAGGGAGVGTGMPMPADSAGGDTGGMFGNGGMSPQLLQFASGVLGGDGFQGGVGKLMGGLLVQKMKQRLQQQRPANPLDQLISGDPGPGQPMV